MYLKHYFGHYDLVIRVEFDEFPKCRLTSCSDSDDFTPVYRITLHTLNLNELHVTTEETCKDFITPEEREKWWIDARLVGKIENV